MLASSQSVKLKRLRYELIVFHFILREAALNFKRI
jgi:hypothetical protein